VGGRGAAPAPDRQRLIVSAGTFCRMG
jgi:hypothetical protein